MTDTKAQHTPGPWKIKAVTKPHELTAIESNMGHLIARAYCPETRKTGEANARLIAAAPELLEACKALLAYTEFDSDDEQECIDHAQARAAIAAATGGDGL